MVYNLRTTKLGIGEEMTDCIHHERIIMIGNRPVGTCIKCRRIKEYPTLGELEDHLSKKKHYLWRNAELSKGAKEQYVRW